MQRNENAVTQEHATTVLFEPKKRLLCSARLFVFWIVLVVFLCSAQTIYTTAGCEAAMSGAILFYFFFLKKKKRPTIELACSGMQNCNQSKWWIGRCGWMLLPVFFWGLAVQFHSSQVSVSVCCWAVMCKLCPNCNCKSCMRVGYNLGCYWVVQVQLFGVKAVCRCWIQVQQKSGAWSKI